MKPRSAIEGIELERICDKPTGRAAAAMLHIMILCLRLSLPFSSPIPFKGNKANEKKEITQIICRRDFFASVTCGQKIQALL